MSKKFKIEISFYLEENYEDLLKGSKREKVRELSSEREFWVFLFIDGDARLSFVRILDSPFKESEKLSKSLLC